VALDRVGKVYVRGGTAVQALSNVTLEVKRGDFCAFIGPSGCGKSTLLNLIAGLDHPTSGTIVLDGRNVGGFTGSQWTMMRREYLGIVFQAFHLIPGLSAEENVALPLLLKGERGASVSNRVRDVLETVNMWKRRRHRPGELSGGEQQRVAIARAIVHRPSLVLADEPTGNLDSKNGAEIVELLRSLPDQFGHTVMLVTHSWTAAQAADYVWEMRDGRLLGQVTQYTHPG
ncbi:MAG TPA: ABC transporter ATP-binding protein, partial [Nitrospiraceae bacterium]|nr:ABC transporter ATP-binding protein [Nitrospiraceae bacterium]